MKIKATQWLQEKGYLAVTEFSFGRDRVDVVGQNEFETVGIECGNTPYQKLLRLSRVLDSLYVWLYYDEQLVLFVEQAIKYREIPREKVGKTKLGLDELHNQYNQYFPRAFI